MYSVAFSLRQSETISEWPTFSTKGVTFAPAEQLSKSFSVSSFSSSYKIWLKPPDTNRLTAWNYGRSKMGQTAIFHFFHSSLALLLPLFVAQMCVSFNHIFSLHIGRVWFWVTASSTLSWACLSTWAVHDVSVTQSRKLSAAWRGMYIASSAQFASAGCI